MMDNLIEVIELLKELILLNKEILEHVKNINEEGVNTYEMS